MLYVVIKWNEKTSHITITIIICIYLVRILLYHRYIYMYIYFQEPIWFKCAAYQDYTIVHIVWVWVINMSHTARWSKLEAKEK